MTAMTMPLGCDDFAGKLADHLEGELPDAVRAAMEMHASGCADCGRLLSELDALRMKSAALPLLEPARDLWAGIAERIDARVLPLDAPRASRLAAGPRTWRHPAVAAAALMLMTAGVTHVWTRMSYDTPLTVASGSTEASPTLVSPPPTVEAVPETAGGRATTLSSPSSVSSGEPTVTRDRTTESRSGAAPARMPLAPRVTQASDPGSAGGIMRTQVEPVYDREIVKLRAIVRERRGQLDPQTVAVLEQSIAVIDSAIAQSRAALAKDPASGFLATQLNHSLEKKVELLRTAAMLPART
jgi:hypothetical protein